MSDAIQLSNDLKNKNVLKGKQFKSVTVNDLNYSEVNNFSNVYIYNSSVLSSDVAFIRSVQKDFGSLNFPASSVFTYKGSLSSTATGSSSALYELLRGYLYRDDSLTSNTSISSVVSSKTSGNALTGFRLIMFNKSIIADNIKPTSFRMSVTPVNNLTSNSVGLNLDNSTITDLNTTGLYSAITNDGSLSGSTTGGLATLSALNEFTVMMKVKPAVGGAPIQTLFHRRVGDKSLSSIGINSSLAANNNKISMYHYGYLGPQNIEVSASGIYNGSSTSYGSTGSSNYAIYTSPLNTINLVAYYSSTSQYFSITGNGVTSTATSFVLNITNVGGGNIKIGFADGGQFLGDPTTYNFIHVLTSGTTATRLNQQSFVQQINGIDYLNSTSATVTCTTNFFNSRVIALVPSMGNQTVTIGYNLKIYSSNNLQSGYTNNINQYVNIPVILTIIPTQGEIAV